MRSHRVKTMLGLNNSLLSGNPHREFIKGSGRIRKNHNYRLELFFLPMLKLLGLRASS